MDYRTGFLRKNEIFYTLSRLRTLNAQLTAINAINYTATQKKKCQNPRTRPYIPYVFEVADSESVVHLTPSPQGQGQVKVKFTKLTATKV